MYLIVDNHDAMCVGHLGEILSKRGLPYTVLDRAASLDAVDVASLRGVFLSGGDGIDLTAPLSLDQISLDSACLTSLSVPVFGICMGFEIIVALLGGTLAQVPGPMPAECVPVSVHVPESIFLGLPRRICMMEFNSIHATSVPSVLTVAASSQRSPIEAIVHATRPIVATQFHPEATDAQGRHSPLGLRIVNNFLDMCQATPPGWW